MRIENTITSKRAEIYKNGMREKGHARKNILTRYCGIMTPCKFKSGYCEYLPGARDCQGIQMVECTSNISIY